MPGDDGNEIERIYAELLRCYGPQGWWPLLGFEGEQPDKTGSRAGYHPGRYDLPATAEQVFEVCVGAILTQNTAWVNVEAALRRLRDAGGLDPEGLLALDEDRLREAIRPAGFFNQKARKLREFTAYFRKMEGRVPSREELLALWGIGRETADSMLLYAFRVPIFVVDAYTRRIAGNLGLIDPGADYDEIRALFEQNLPRDLAMYQEYHALLVEHAKRHYRKGGAWSTCPLRRIAGE
jgi:endonuclease-3 related protein